MNGLFNGNILAGSALRVNRILLTPTREYQDVYLRPYQLNVQDIDLNKLEAILNRANPATNGLVTSGAIANSIPNTFNPSGVVSGRADIVNGWGQKRIKFLLEVESDRNGSVFVSYIQGYTDYHDPSLSGMVDPNMTFFVNSITNVIRTVDPVGNMYTRFHSNFNLVTNHGSRGYEENISMLKANRPMDLINNLSSRNLFDSDGTTVLDTTNNIGAQVITSSKTNNNSSEFLAKTITGFYNSSINNPHANPAEKYDSALDNLAEADISRVPFIQCMAGLTGELQPTTFTLGQLAKVRPDLLDPNSNCMMLVTQDTIDPIQTGGSILDSDHTENLYASTIENSIAYNITESITGFMSDNLIQVLDVVISNSTGQYEVFVLNARSFIDGLDITAYVDIVVNKIRTVLLPAITQNNEVQVHANVSSDSMGDTNIAISVNNQAETLIRYPSFGDSLFAPVVSDEQGHQSLSGELSKVLNLVDNSVVAQNVNRPPVADPGYTHY